MKSLLTILLFVFSLVTFASECLNHQQQEHERKEIRDFINKSKSCNTSSECIIIDLGCPFGCGTALNKNHVQLVVKETNKYHAKSCNACKYKCKPVIEAECVNNKCIEK